MKLFKKKRDRMENLQSNHTADKIAQSILTVQRKIAAYLEKKTRYWNRPSKLIALILFTAAFGGFSLYLLLKAVL
jgi:hypothetical protein